MDILIREIHEYSSLYHSFVKMVGGEENSYLSGPFLLI
jgi:hypothetical protein